MPIEVITGPMFAAKTTSLVSRAEVYKYTKKSYVVIKHSSDTRYSKEPELVTHNGVTFEAKLVSSLDYRSYLDYEIVLIDEAQFFTGLVEFCVTLSNLGKTVIAAGLLSDINLVPFGEVQTLLLYAEQIHLLKAVCSVCLNVNATLTSKKLIPRESASVPKESIVPKEPNSNFVEVGSESYFPVCLKCKSKQN